MIAPALYQQSTQRARKTHRCCECHAVIPIGQIYWRCSGLWDESFGTHKAHAHCSRFRARYNDALALSGVDYEYLAAIGYVGETIDEMRTWDASSSDWHARWHRLRDWTRERYGIWRSTPPATIC